MKLPLIYAQLRTRAAQTGQDQHADLPGGARLAVRVCNGLITVSFCRQKKPVGTTEEATFRAACQVPGSAKRIPEVGQKAHLDNGVMWNIVAYRWSA